jgi:hypothetical protein
MIVRFPGRAILVIKLAALRWQFAISNANHDVLGGLTISPLDPTGQQFVRRDGELSADRNWVASFTAEVIAFDEAQQFADDMAW